MNIASRSYLIAGLAAISASAIALTPVQPVSNYTQLAARTMGVELAATIDPIQPLVDLIEATLANTATITQQIFNPGPGLPILNALGSNLGVYLGQLPRPDLGTIAGQILDNVSAGITAPLDPNLGTNPLGGPEISWNTNNTTVVTCFFATTCTEGFTKLVTTGLLVVTPGFEELAGLINLLSSPLSGALMGLLSPGLSTVAQVIDSVRAVTTAVNTGNWAGAVNEVINLPTNVVNAFLNGGKQLDLTGIVNALAPVLGLDIPAGTKLGIATGGLLSPGIAVGGGFLDFPPTIPIPFGGWGGTAWDSISAEADLSGIEIFINGLPVGPISTLLGIRTAVANAIRLPVPNSVQATAASATQPAAAVQAPIQSPVQPPAAVAEAPAPKRTAHTARGAGSERRSVAAVTSATPAPAAAVADQAPAPKRTAPAARSGGSDKAGHSARGARNAS